MTGGEPNKRTFSDLEKARNEAGEPKPPRTKAEDNPWYLLATLYGVPGFEDRELRTKNRVAWNRYFAGNLDGETRAKLIEEKRHPAEELTPFSAEELQEVADAFAERRKVSAKKLALPARDAYIDFSNVEFERDALFQRYLFSKSTSFQGSTFSGGASFIGATFRPYPSSASSSFEASFERATISVEASFRRATFCGEASFERADFSGDAEFLNASFSQGASFDGATFSSWAIFRGAAFSDWATFDGATFSVLASFDGAAFSGPAYFDKPLAPEPASSMRR